VAAVYSPSAPRTVTFKKGAPELGTPAPDFTVATPKAPTLSPKYRLVGRRGIVRPADGARMTLGDDHVFPQSKSDDEWADVTSQDSFLLGDIFHGELLPFEQVEGAFARAGAFDAFLRGEPIATLGAAKGSAPPTMKREVDANGATFLSTSGAPVGFLEMHDGDRATRIDLAASSRIEQRFVEKGHALHVRACSVVGPYCSAWESIHR
jgi:hypothetical protein